MLANLVTGLAGSLGNLWYIVSHGGWAVLLLVAVLVLYKRYRAEITHQFLHNQEWVFLHVRGIRENLSSLLSVEQIYSQLHVVHSGLSFMDKHIEGKIQLWYMKFLVLHQLAFFESSSARSSSSLSWKRRLIWRAGPSPCTLLVRSEP